MKKKKEIDNLDNSRYIAQQIEEDRYEINVDDLHEIICKLRTDYMYEYHQEPRCIVVPEFLPSMLNHFFATSWNRETQTATYMGMLLIPTPAIKYIEYIKVY